MSTNKTKVRNAMGKHHKTVSELARATHLSEGAVRGALTKLVASGYTKREMVEGVDAYRRIRS